MRRPTAKNCASERRFVGLDATAPGRSHPDHRVARHPRGQKRALDPNDAVPCVHVPRSGGSRDGGSASAAYIKSQAHEGWKLVRERYDDEIERAEALACPAHGLGKDVHLHRPQFVSLAWQRRDADVRAGLHVGDCRRDDEYEAGLGIEVDRSLLARACAHVQARAVGGDALDGRAYGDWRILGEGGRCRQCDCGGEGNSKRLHRGLRSRCFAALILRRPGD